MCDTNNIKRWLINLDVVPESHLNSDQIRILNHKIEENENLCISGFFNTGKTTTLLLLYRRLYIENRGRILLLVYRKIDEERFKEALKELGCRDSVETYWAFSRHPSRYDYILCDNVHLMGRSLLSEIKQKANQVIVTINPELRLFESSLLSQEPPLSFNDVQEILQPSVYELNLYPFGNNAIRIVKPLLNKLVASGSLLHDGYYAQICKAVTDQDESKFIHDQAQRVLSRGFSAAVLIPTNRGIVSFINNLIKLEGKDPWEMRLSKWGRIDYSDLNKYMCSIGLNYQFIGNGSGSVSDMDKKINLMTYHGSMGFVFDYVFMPNLNSDLFISYDESISLNLFVLALTRSKMNQYLLYSGSLHPYLERIKDYCVIRDISEEQNDNTSTI